jgi:hypothetical protein
MPVVFLGTVEKADPDEPASHTIFRPQSVVIRVDEAFKGVAKGQTVQLDQGANDCAAKFRTGQRAVFYLNTGGIPASWSVPACIQLGSAEPGGDDLLFLRGLPNSAAGTRLSGEIELYEDGPAEAFHRVAGVPNIKVSIRGPAGRTQDTVTNASGVYEVYGLPPGRYSVGIDVPKGLKTKFPITRGAPVVRGDDEAAVELAANGGVSVGFVLQADTRLSGHMLDAKGAPLTGICMDLELVRGAAENGGSNFTCSKEGGAFEMTMMPPGKYLIVAHDEIRFGIFKSKIDALLSRHERSPAR